MTVTLPEIPVVKAASQHAKWEPRKERNVAQTKPATPADSDERPFQLDVVYITTGQQQADAFMAYVRDSYDGWTRVNPIPNQGQGISAAIVFHYCFSRATDAFMQGLYAFLTGPDTFLWLGVDGLPPRLYAGRE